MKHDYRNPKGDKIILLYHYNDPIWIFPTKVEFGENVSWLVLTLGDSNGTRGSQIW